jgi:glycosyltransferase involved in cell wall biosynthesis
MKQCLQIAAALGEAGYVVDIADVFDDRHFPTGNYNLVVSHRVDQRHGREFFCPDTTYVYLASGMNHIVHNRYLRARYDALNARRGCELQPLTLNTESMPYVRFADAVAGFGNSLTVGTWSEATEAAILPFNNYGFASISDRSTSKDFGEACRNFLFFASRDQVGKGLDLLLEIFPRTPDLHLYVCSAFAHEKSFVKCFERELYHTPNIHPIGRVPIKSQAFDDLVSRCAYVILPTCSEGQPGSVVQCMHAGLIPLVTRESGIDLKDLGAIFPDNGISSIENSIVEVAARPKEWHRQQALGVRRLALDAFSEHAFVRRWAAILRGVDLLQRKEQGR